MTFFIKKLYITMSITLPVSVLGKGEFRYIIRLLFNSVQNIVNG